LRLAPTEQLKGLIARGESRVFEFSRNLRDDLEDETHLPEFTSLEYMATETSWAEIESLSVDLFASALRALERYSTDTMKRARWEAWAHESVTHVDVAEHLATIGITEAVHVGAEALRECLRATIGLRGEERSVNEMLDEIMTEEARKRGGVVLMSGFPEGLGGPAQPHPTRPGFKQRTEMYVDGVEVANMSVNMNDIGMLQKWHSRGLETKRMLEIEPNARDDELFESLRDGLPDSAVIGIGVERVLQVILGLDDIRRVVPPI
jgi:lysyl-tRNA synthetase class 2